MAVKLRKKTLEEQVEQIIFDVALLKVQYQRLLDTLSQTVMEEKT